MRLLLFLLFCVLLVSCGRQAANKIGGVDTATTTRASVVRVVDGDTIKVSIAGDEHSVRLIGIDTPETHKPGVKVECGGREASANLERLAPPGAAVRVVADSSQDEVDRYGRMLGYVYVTGRQLELAQLRAGLAEVYVYQGRSFAHLDSYRRAQDAAKRARRGVWGACGGDFHSEQAGR